jgi:hypothetical protein
MLRQHLDEILAMREPDEYGKRVSLAKIGKQYGVTRERVRQLIGNTGRSKNGKWLKDDALEIARAIHFDRTTTYAQVAKDYGLSVLYAKMTIPTKFAFEKMTGEKYCQGCATVKKLGEFYPVPTVSGETRGTWCKQCSADKHRQWYKNNRERFNKYMRDRRKKGKVK